MRNIKPKESPDSLLKKIKPIWNVVKNVLAIISISDMVEICMIFME